MKHLNLLLDSALAKKQDANNDSHDFTIHFDPAIVLDPSKMYKAALNELVTMFRKNVTTTNSNGRKKKTRIG